MNFNKELKEKYEQAVDFFYDNNCYLATEITKLGYPKESNIVPTAGVAWNSSTKKIEFLFNKEFYGMLNSFEEFCFIVAHEAMHLINGHIFMFATDVKQMKENKIEEHKIGRHIQKLNIAADCVVNDTLVNSYKLNPVLDDHEVCPAIRGQKVVNCDCENLYIREVYSMIPESKEQTIEVDNHMWESFFDENGNLKEEFVDKIKGIVQRNLGSSQTSDEEQRAIEDLKDQIEKNEKAAGRGVGSIKGDVYSVVKTNDSIRWNRLLLELKLTRKLEDKWNKQNRRTMSVYPDMILPASDEIEREHAHVFVDVSSSIDHAAVNKFINVVRNVPKNITIVAHTFTTHVNKWDIDKNPSIGGGTSFDIIENYILNNYKKYPKAVFVLTDGCGNYVKPKYPSRWAWLLYGAESTQCIGNMKRFSLDKLLAK